MSVKQDSCCYYFHYNDYEQLIPHLASLLIPLETNKKQYKAKAQSPRSRTGSENLKEQHYLRALTLILSLSLC